MGLDLNQARSGLHDYLKRFGNRRTATSDLKAGLVLGIESVPDGLAAGLLAGVNPLHGLYGYLLGTIGGALATGSAYMTVQATGAMSVVISDIPQTQGGEQSGTALATLAVLTGLVMLGLGVARLGSLVRFIPTAVLVGFINAVAINIVLGQFDDLTGYESQGPNRIARAIDTMANFIHFSLPACFVGALTIALILLLERTRLGALAMVVAVVAGSGVAALLSVPFIGAEVSLLNGVATVPSALPTLQPPSFGLVGAMIIPAFSLALVGLVQGAAISGSIPNPDGTYPDASSDFRGQGIANLAAGLFQGMPVGGSMSATSLVRTAGAKTALANLTAGVVMALCIVALGPAIGYIAMPSLAGLLFLVGIRTLKIHDVVMVWKTGPIQATVLAVTFALTLLIPLQYSVLTGVGLAVVLHVARLSNRITVRRWIFDNDGKLPSEVDPPRVLEPNDLVILVPYGSLFFAAAPVFEGQLPKAMGNAHGTAVIIRLRGKDELGSTFIKTLEQYARSLEAAGGVMMLAGVGTKVNDQLVATRAIDSIGAGNVFIATPRVGDSLQQAMQAVDAWRTRCG